MNHFATSCSHDETGRFMVPLPKKPHTKPLGESRSQAVRSFLSLERSLHGKEQFQELQAVVKSSSTTTRVRAVFDASVKTSTGVSLNDQLLVGPTVHSSLVDVLMRFRLHRVALTTDVSRMYRAIALCPSDRDLHRFIWRRDPSDTLKDYRMTRITFGVSASSFIANMCVKQNAEDHIHKYPEAALAVRRSFYVDDGLVGPWMKQGNFDNSCRIYSLLVGFYCASGNRVSLLSSLVFLLTYWTSSPCRHFLILITLSRPSE